MGPSTDINLVNIEKYANEGGFFAYTCIANIVTNAISVVLMVAGLAFFFYLVWGGLDWMLSGGDKTKIQNAQSKLSSALIGLTIIATSWAVYLLVMYFLGIDTKNICKSDPTNQEEINIQQCEEQKKLDPKYVCPI